MFNLIKENKMDKTILVVEIIKYNTMEPNYSIKKVADNLDKASEYVVALKNLNDNPKITYVLFNRLGQFEVDRIEKVESDGDNEIAI